MDNISHKIMTEKEFYETYKMPERAKMVSITRVRCECGRVVNLNNIRRHEKSAPHLKYLEKKAC